MSTPLFSSLLTALVLHVMGLTVLSLGWQAWRASFPLSQPVATVPIAVVPVPEPSPPAAAEPVTPPQPLSMPAVDSAPEPLAATPATLAPPPPPPVVPPQPSPRATRAPPSRSAPPRPRPPSPSPPAPAQRQIELPPGLPNEPPGEASRGAAGLPALPAVPAPEPSPQPASGGAADIGQPSAHGSLPVAPDGGGGGDGGGRGSGGGGTGTGAGGGTGPGRGGAGGGSGVGGGSGLSARPLGGYQVKPRYPESARRRGIEGTVLLKMRITAQGRVEELQVERSAGHPDLDHSAMEAVQRWRFEPARRSGEPVAMWVLIPVEFKLQ